MPLTELSFLGLVATALITALLISFVATPVVKSLAQKVGAVDVPKDGRRMHDHPIPRMGGLAIFLGFTLAVLVFADLTRQLQGMLLGAVIIVVLGIFDDIYALRASFKFVVQIIAALVAVLYGGNVISVLSNVLPAQTAAMIDAALGGDVAAARRWHQKLLPLMKDLFNESNPIPVKFAAGELGLCRDELRLPLVPAGERTRELVRADLLELGALEAE